MKYNWCSKRNTNDWLIWKLMSLDIHRAWGIMYKKEMTMNKFAREHIYHIY